MSTNFRHIINSVISTTTNNFRLSFAVNKITIGSDGITAVNQLVQTTVVHLDTFHQPLATKEAQVLLYATISDTTNLMKFSIIKKSELLHALQTELYWTDATHTGNTFFIQLNCSKIKIPPFLREYAEMYNKISHTVLGYKKTRKHTPSLW